MVMAVAALLVAMLVASAMPALAKEFTFGTCHKAQNQGPGVITNSDFNEQFNPFPPERSQSNQPGSPVACGKQ
jgi:hypothetical protein